MQPRSSLPHFDQERLHSAQLKVPMAVRNSTVEPLMVAEDICASLKLNAADATGWPILTSNSGHIEDEHYFIVDLDSISEDRLSPFASNDAAILSFAEKVKRRFLFLQT